MLRFVADGNFSDRLLRGLVRRGVDVVSVQDIGPSGVGARAVLKWAAREGRIVLTHDRRTMGGEGEKLVAEGGPDPAVFAVNRRARLADLAEDILEFSENSTLSDWAGTITFLPLPWRLDRSPAR